MRCTRRVCPARKFPVARTRETCSHSLCWAGDYLSVISVVAHLLEPPSLAGWQQPFGRSGRRRPSMVQGKEAARREPLQIGCVPRSNHQMIREYKPCCIIISGGCLVAGARRPRVAVGGKETCGMRTHLYCECRDAEHRGWKLVTHSLSSMYYQMVAQPIRCKRRAWSRVTSAQHVEATPPPCGPCVDDRPRCQPPQQHRDRGEQRRRRR